MGTSHILPTFEFMMQYSIENDDLPQLAHKFLLIGAKPPRNFFRIYPSRDGMSIQTGQLTFEYYRSGNFHVEKILVCYIFVFVSFMSLSMLTKLNTLQHIKAAPPDITALQILEWTGCPTYSQRGSVIGILWGSYSQFNLFRNKYPHDSFVQSDWIATFFAMCTKLQGCLLFRGSGFSSTSIKSRCLQLRIALWYCPYNVMGCVLWCTYCACADHRS